MNPRKTLDRLLPLSLMFGLLVTACDGGSGAAAEKDEKAASEKPEATKPAEAVPAEAVPEEAVPEEAEPAEPEEAEPEDAEPADAEPDEPDEPEDAEPAEPEAKPPTSRPPTKKKSPEPEPDEPDGEPASGGSSGKEIYAKKCKSCHGTTGAADTKIAQKHDIGSWKEPGWKGKWSQSKIEDIVENGKSGTKMKAFKDKLTPEEIVAVSTYARSLGN